MGWTFYNIATLPAPGDIVWCKWPYKEDRGRPGKIVRPALVRASIVHEDEAGTVYGSVIVSYTTGEFTPAHLPYDLVVTDAGRVRALGLHKPTRFSLDPSDRKNLLWCKEYFIGQQYARERKIHVGSLGEAELDRMTQCLIRRGLPVDRDIPVDRDKGTAAAS